MIRRRNLVLLSLLFFVLFILTTNYLLITLPSESEVRKQLTVEEKIYYELNKLPVEYITKTLIEDKTVDIFINVIQRNVTVRELNLDRLWTEANSWVSKTQLINLTSPNLGKLFVALKNAKIINADVDTRGTQLKLLLTLEVLHCKHFIH